MLDINFIRENQDAVRKDLQRRRIPQYTELLDTVLKLDDQWRALKGKIDNARARRNKVSAEINAAKKAGKDAATLIKEAAEIPKLITEAELELAKLAEDIKQRLYKIPNIMHETVPYGKDDSENVTVKSVGKKPTFDFTPLSHIDLMQKHGWADLERAAKISGARWYFLKGDLAVLEMALSQYALELMRGKGYTQVIPPHMISREAYEGVTSLGDFEDSLYKIDGEELFPIATSEAPLTAIYRDEVLDEKDLPIKMVGYSPCYRKEAGAHGKDQKGIFRVHQFNKVEQIVFCTPEESWKFHEELIGNAIEFFESLGLHFRVVNICTGDLGIVAAKKYDIEAWYPVQNAYREVVSGSNCTSYQSVRSNIRYQKGKDREFVHTLNSTCVATTRAVVAILENFQDKNGAVHIPKVLQKYTGFKTMGAKSK
ncbi:serine--tRNA ligase [Candidatus Woesearchaeota archaeon]|nr:serine--tRNA ligase [Candidatus Woesearchaeota archaeon]